jgi:hypothetical protein
MLTKSHLQPKGPVNPCTGDRSNGTYARCRECPRNENCVDKWYLKRQQWCMTCGAVGHSAVDCTRGAEESVA